MITTGGATINNSGLSHRIVRVAAGGLIGFLILLFCWSVVLVVVMQSASFFSPATLSAWQILVLLALIPGFIFGGGVTAWALGANLRRRFIAGMIVFFTLAILDTGQSNYSLFNTRETMAFVGAALASVVIAVAGTCQTRAWISAVILALALIGLSVVVPGSGLIISLVSWLALPLTATLLGKSKSEKPSQTTRGSFQARES